MYEWITITAYPWIKALHIIAIIAWMAGLLYLPRLFVYHADVPPGSRRAAMLEIMERRLLRGIMLPAVLMTYGFGGLLLSVPGIVDWRQAAVRRRLQPPRDEPVGDGGLAGVAAGEVGDRLLQEKGGR